MAAEEIFREHMKWMAFTQNSMSWPKYWRAVIFRIQRRYDITRAEEYLMVLPINPDYTKYSAECDARGYVDLDDKAPPMHLPAIRFDSIEDIDRWAAVAARLEGKQ